MKLSPLLLIIALAMPACVSSPQEKAAKHQRELEEQAQEKFEEQKEHEKDAREKAAEDSRRQAEDIADARQRAAEDAAKYKAYLEEYAKQLGKKPSQLNRDELQWVRAHYNN